MGGYSTNLYGKPLNCFIEKHLSSCMVGRSHGLSDLRSVFRMRLIINFTNPDQVVKYKIVFN